MHIRVYLPWEIEFNKKYLKGNLQKFVPYAAFLKLCIEEKYPVTVNQLRELAAGEEHFHPDKNAIKYGLRPAELGDRGERFVFEEVEGDEPDDNKIPEAVIMIYRDLKLKELGDKTINEKREFGGLSREEIEKMFPDLFKPIQ